MAISPQELRTLLDNIYKELGKAMPDDLWSLLGVDDSIIIDEEYLKKIWNATFADQIFIDLIISNVDEIVVALNEYANAYLPEFAISKKILINIEDSIQDAQDYFSTLTKQENQQFIIKNLLFRFVIIYELQKNIDSYLNELIAKYMTKRISLDIMINENDADVDKINTIRDQFIIDIWKHFKSKLNQFQTVADKKFINLILSIFPVVWCDHFYNRIKQEERVFIISEFGRYFNDKLEMIEVNNFIRLRCIEQYRALNKLEDDFSKIKENCIKDACLIVKERLNDWKKRYWSNDHAILHEDLDIDEIIDVYSEKARSLLEKDIDIYLSILKNIDLSKHDYLLNNNEHSDISIYFHATNYDELIDQAIILSQNGIINNNDLMANLKDQLLMDDVRFVISQVKVINHNKICDRDDIIILNKLKTLRALREAFIIGNITKTLDSSTIKKSQLQVPNKKQEVENYLNDLFLNTGIKHNIESKTDSEIIIKFSSNDFVVIKNLCTIINTYNQLNKKNNKRSYLVSIPNQPSSNKTVEVTWDGKINIILNLLRNNRFRDEINKKLSIIKESTDIKEIIEIKENTEIKNDKNNNNSSKVQDPYQKDKSIILTDQQILDWMTEIKVAFCHAENVKVEYTNQNNCLRVMWNQNDRWLIRKFEGKHHELMEVKVSKDIINDQIVSRLRNKIEDPACKIGELNYIAGQNQLEITLKKPVISFKGIYKSLTNYFNNKTKPKVANNGLFASSTKNQDTARKSDKDEKREVSVNQDNNKVNKEQQIMEFLSLIIKCIRDEPFTEFQVKHVINKRQQQIPNEKNKKRNSNKKSNLYEISISSSSNSIHQRDGSPIASTLFLQALADYFSNIPNFITIQTEPFHLVINHKILVQVNKNIDQEKFNECLAKYINQEQQNNSTIQLTAIDYNDQDVAVKSTLKAINIDHLITMYRRAIENINNIDPSFLAIHLSELKSLKVSSIDILDKNNLNYLLHFLIVMRALATCAKNIGYKDNIFYDWRNVLRHASSKLNWVEFHQLSQLLIIVLERLSMVNSNINYKPQDIDRIAIREFYYALEIFNADITNKTLHNEINLELYHKQLDNLIETADGTIESIKAIVMLCALIGEQYKVDPFVSIYRKLGHGDIFDFDETLKQLYNYYFNYNEGDQPSLSFKK